MRRPSSAMALWVALVATLLSGTGGIGDRRGGTAPPVTSLKVPPLPTRDLRQPRFSNPTAITNPLLPIAELTQVVQLGAEGGDRLRIEMTRLPGTRVVEWSGAPVTTVVSQLVAYSNGRVAEVSTDFHAQADDGAVWHFGEEAANYDDGVLVDREGSWLAGREGPPGKVMPARPRVGEMFRSQTPPGWGADEVTVRATGQTVDGPRGRVDGALLLQERLADGTLEEKTFAPGYGELSARVPSEDELYSVAVTVPTDVVGTTVPAELASIAGQAERILAPGEPDWTLVAGSVGAMTEAWTRVAPAQGPGILESQMIDRLADLVAAAADRRPAQVRRAALGVSQAGLDLQLRHRPAAEVDRDRFGLWTRLLQLDARAGDLGAVKGDAVVLDALAARHHDPSAAGGPLDAALADLRDAVAAPDLGRAAALARSLPLP